MKRIALAQINPTVGDLKGNQKKILDFLAKAKSQDADLVVFPELVVCGYPPEDLLHKEHFVKDNIKVLKELARKVKNIVAIVGFVDLGSDKKLYNAAAVISNGKVVGIYHKEDLPNYGVFDEKRYFHPGVNEKIYCLGEVCFGVNICEDIWTNNTVCSKQSRKGAKVLINISSSPYDMDKLNEREKLLKQRAKENKAFVFYVNLVGGQDELVFDGSSLVVNPEGEIIARAKAFEEDLITTDVALRSGKKQRGKDIVNVAKGSLSKRYKKSTTKAIVPKLSQVESIYKALVLGTHDYIKKSGFQKVLIGLSGGIDSSLVAAIAVDAVGENNVVGVTMPSRFTSKGTHSDAKALAKNLEIELKEIPIEEIYKSYGKTLKNQFSGQKAGVAEENIQARIRGNILMAFSNKYGWLVLTTGNKSEVAVGYCTLYGDMSGGFAVIKDVPKMKVYELAKYRNEQGEVIPKSVIKRAPSAELRSNQKDQDSLPAYKVLDEMLTDYVEKHRSFQNMSGKNAQRLVKKIINLVDHNEYKRRQAPPGIKITPRAFGRDWRLPIINKYKEF